MFGVAFAPIDALPTVRQTRNKEVKHRMLQITSVSPKEHDTECRSGQYTQRGDTTQYFEVQSVLTPVMIGAVRYL